MEFEYLPLDIRRSLLHEERRYNLNREYVLDEELQRMKQTRCLDKISKTEIKNAVNDGVSFLLFNESAHESYLRSISSHNKEFTNSNWKISRQGPKYTIYEERYMVYDVNATDDKIFYSSNSEYHPLGYYVDHKIDYEFVILTNRSIEEIFLLRGDLCRTHLNEFKTVAILEQYEKLSGVLLDLWLVACLKDTGINHDEIVSNRNYNVNDISNKRDILPDIILNH